RPPTSGSPTLSLHDALPIFAAQQKGGVGLIPPGGTELNNARPLHTYLAPPFALAAAGAVEGRYLCSVVREYRWVLFMRACAIIKDRKSTRLNSSHVKILYAV